MLWGTDQVDAALKKGLRGLKDQGRKRMKDSFARAIDYLKGTQVEDTRALLYERFPSTQQGDTGQQIAPVTIGLTSRFAKEAATLYNRPVKRTIVNEDGSTNAEATALVTEEYKRCRWDEVMHANDRIVVVNKTNCILHEPRRGRLRPRITYAHDVYPVAPMTPEFMSADDPDDYEAFVIELFWAIEDVTKVQAKTYLWHDMDRYVFYEGSAPDQPTRVLSEWENPYSWYQTVEELNVDTGMRTISDRLVPGRMLTFWHTELPVGELMIDCDSDIVEANRELNVAWSMLFDIIRWQGGAVPVLRTPNKDTKSRRKFGVRFPLLLRPEETFEMLNAAVDYTGQVEVLKTFAKVVALTKSMSPNDFDIDGANVLSGIAKIIDNLPKMEAREDRARRSKAMEEVEAWPRNAAILVQQGRASEGLLKLKMQVEYADLELPHTEEEKTKRIERDVKYNQANVVEMLMKRYGIDEDEAIEKLERNAELNRRYGPNTQQQQARQFGGVGMAPGFGQSIRQRSAPQAGDDGDERSTAQRDRQAGGAYRQSQVDNDRNRRG